MIIPEKISEILEDVITIRREIHRNPEIGFELPKTSALVKKELSAYGVDEIICAGKSSVVGTIRGKKGPGKCIGLRCDMDALPVLEETGLSFCSLTPGAMHACGHDLHTAMMLGIARTLCDMRDKFSGTVKVIFEAGEETQPGGAIGIIESGAVDDVDAFFATHVIPSDDNVGLIGIRKGAVTTSADEVKIKIHGKSSHGSQPQNANDAILAATQINLLLQQIQARNISPLDTCILSMNLIQGGAAINIIADYCYMEGALRAYTQEARTIATEKIREICKGIETLSGCKIDANISLGYDACYNDEDLVDLITGTLGEENYYILKEPMSFSEDYSFFGTKTGKPSVLMFLNAGHAPGMKVSVLHRSDCTFDEDAMKYGMAAIVNSALAFLKE
ncbi:MULTISPECIES: M20 family metallopeptidase [Clostridia]|uniref:M20 metallopeptidase family protein n=1 Tax=Clostridia TaxID=186801 RepID=UPI0013634AB1|nr:MULTISPECIES: M20 family metallopeptidase [Clostridia]